MYSIKFACIAGLAALLLNAPSRSAAQWAGGTPYVAQVKSYYQTPKNDPEAATSMYATSSASVSASTNRTGAVATADVVYGQLFTWTGMVVPDTFTASFADTIYGYVTAPGTCTAIEPGLTVSAPPNFSQSSTLVQANQQTNGNTVLIFGEYSASSNGANGLCSSQGTFSIASP